MRQWFGVSANAILNTRWTQFINYANYKIIDSNVDRANVTKIQKYSPICQTLSPPWRACAVQGQFRDRERKSLLTSRPQLMTVAQTAAQETVVQLLFPNKSMVKHVTWSNSGGLRYTVLWAVCNASLLFLFFTIHCQSKTRRALYFGISLASLSSN